jgi:hypothetical protein
VVKLRVRHRLANEVHGEFQLVLWQKNNDNEKWTSTIS